MYLYMRRGQQSNAVDSSFEKVINFAKSCRENAFFLDTLKCLIEICLPYAQRWYKLQCSLKQFNSLLFKKKKNKR